MSSELQGTDAVYSSHFTSQSRSTTSPHTEITPENNKGQPSEPPMETGLVQKTNISLLLTELKQNSKIVKVTQRPEVKVVTRFHILPADMHRMCWFITLNSQTSAYGVNTPQHPPTPSSFL